MLDMERDQFKIVRGGFAEPTTAMSTIKKELRLTDTPINASGLLDRRNIERERWLNLVGKRLSVLDNLDAGWDGYDADELPSGTIIFSGMLLASVSSEAAVLPDPTITPMSNGSVMIEWMSSTHELTLEVRAPNDVIVYLEDNANKNSVEYHVASDFEEIRKSIAQCVRIRAVG